MQDKKLAFYDIGDSGNPYLASRAKKNLTFTENPLKHLWFFIFIKSVIEIEPFY